MAARVWNPIQAPLIVHKLNIIPVRSEFASQDRIINIPGDVSQQRSGMADKLVLIPFEDYRKVGHLFLTIESIASRVIDERSRAVVQLLIQSIRRIDL